MKKSALKTLSAFLLAVATPAAASAPPADEALTSTGATELGELEQLRSEWPLPPRESGVRCWWWWLNGNVTECAITRDLEAMADRGFSGAVIFDADGSGQKGNATTPAGPMFGSESWTRLYLHALREADRLGLTLSLSIQSGWNLGGPRISVEDAAKQVTWSETTVSGAKYVEQELPAPPCNDGYYREIRVLAWPRRSLPDGRLPIRDLALKTATLEVGGAAPDCRHLLDDHPSIDGEEDAQPSDVLDLSAQVDAEGTLRWNAPRGDWVVLRIGYTTTLAEVSTASNDWQGRVIDYLSEEAFDNYWDDSVAPLLAAAGPLVGRVLTHLETDSWECGGMNWSPRFPEYFREQNGYDLQPYLPVLAGKIIGSREASNAFLADFRKTIGHCISENHYRVFAERAAEHRLGIHPECSGPHAGPLDGIKNYAHSDLVMTEFWAPSPHRPTETDRFYVKQASSAAHIYGKRLVGAEAFTTIGPHWNDCLWQEQKPAMDYAFCSGLNTVFFHTFTCSPESMGLPGQEYFAGTHVNPRVTWWDESGPFIDYINRVQHITQRGQFIADVLYYYGDHVPNIAPFKGADPAGAMPGYDYDITNEEILLKLEVVDARLVAPSGTSYRLLVLPDHKVLSLAALKKLDALLRSGATVLGCKPERLVSLVEGDNGQREFAKLADRLWGQHPARRGLRTVGAGRLAWGCSSREFLARDGVPPDFEAADSGDERRFEYVHYLIGGRHVYFISNRLDERRRAEFVFRVSGRRPELWDPASGTTRPADRFDIRGETTVLPLTLESHGSVFVVFDKPARGGMDKAPNSPEWLEVGELAGPWEVQFDPRWGGPRDPIRFEKLKSWLEHPLAGVRAYSGHATYRKTFDVSASMAGRGLAVELGDVRDVGIARVLLNGSDLGVVWLPPFRVDVSDALRVGENELEVVVVNSWHNRVMADSKLPPAEKLTKTNIRVVHEGRFRWEPEDAGLLGPVLLVAPAFPNTRSTQTTAVTGKSGKPTVAHGVSEDRVSINEEARQRASNTPSPF